MSTINRTLIIAGDDDPLTKVFDMILDGGGGSPPMKLEFHVLKSHYGPENPSVDHPDSKVASSES